MNNFFLSLVMLGPFWSFVLTVVLILFGGVLAHRFITVSASHRRITHFWRLEIICFTFCVLQIGSAYLPHAAHMGVFWVLCLLLFLTLPLFGASLYCAFSARSNNIAGDTRYAWLGFVPIAHLWLLLKPGDKAKTDYSLAGRAWDASLLGLALIPIWLGAEIVDELSELSTTQTVLWALEENAPSAEAHAYYRVLNLNRNTPAHTHGMIVQKAEADGATIRLLHEVPPHNVEGFKLESKRQYLSQFCNFKRHQMFLAKGGQFELKFETRDGGDLGEIVISQDVCVS
ncbi:MAG: hypothetical protein GJ677_18025 [Rhodobacteraceae bacterium]|nr:hypothetical protein [Paracoccaceae bacterium]